MITPARRTLPACSEPTSSCRRETLLASLREMTSAEPQRKDANKVTRLQELVGSLQAGNVRLAGVIMNEL